MADKGMLPRELPGLEQRLQFHSAVAGVGDAVAVVAVVGIAVAAAAQMQGQSLWAWEIHSHQFLEDSQVGL